MNTPHDTSGLDRGENEAVQMPVPRYFVAGGTLAVDAPSYLTRDADLVLLDALIEGQYSYVLDSRQKGKSSLIARTQQKLEAAGIRTVKIDLQSIGSNLSVDQWYASMVRQVGRQLGLEQEAFRCWGDNYQIGAFGRWLSVIEQVILPNTSDPIVVFIDEVDFVRSLPFSTDELFAGIRECFNRRATDESFTRLTFCLIGSATPSQLVHNVAITPFNIGEEIKLTDFDRAELAPYAEVLNGGRNGNALLDRVYHWTNGHPFLTQSICSLVARDPSISHPQDIDRLVEERYLSPEARQREPNLLDVSRRLLETPVEGVSREEARGQILNAYEQVLRGRKLLIDDSEWRLATLRLCGAVTAEGGTLVVRNEIYRRAFDLTWIGANMPDAELRRQRNAARRATWKTSLVAAVVVIAVSAAALGFQRVSADRKLALDKLQRRTEEVERQNYAGKIASIRLAIATDRWMRAADLVDQVKTDPNRGWEWGHLALALNHRANEPRLTRNTLLEPGANDTLLATTEVGTCEIDKDGRATAQTQFDEKPISAAHRIGNFLVAENASGSFVLKMDTGEVLARGSFGELHFFDLDPARSELLCTPDYATVQVRSSDGKTVKRTFKDRDQVMHARILADGSYLTVHPGERFVRRDRNGNAQITVQGDSGKRFEYPFRTQFNSDRSMWLSWAELKVTRLLIRRTLDLGTVSQLQTPPMIVSCAAFSPDSKELLVGGADGLLRRFNVETGALLERYPGHKNPVQSVAYFPSGDRFGSIDVHGYVKVWARPTVPAVEVHDLGIGQMYDGALSQGGLLLAVSFDGRLAVKNLHTGQVARWSDSRVKSLFGISAPLQKTIAVGLPDGVVTLLNKETLKPIHTVKVLDERVRTLKRFNKGAFLFVDGVNRNCAVVDSATLEVVAKFSRPKNRHTGIDGQEESLGFDQEGEFLVVVAPRAVDMFSLDSGQSVRRWTLDRPAGSPQQEERLIEGSEQDNFRRMAMVPGSRQVLVAVGDAATPDRLLLLPLEGPPDPILLGKTEVGMLSYSPSGKVLGVISWDGGLKLWDANTGSEIARMPTGSMVYRMIFSKDEKRLLTSGTGGDISLWDVGTLNDIMTLDYDRPKTSKPGMGLGDHIRFSDDGKSVVLFCLDGKVRIFNSIPWRAASGASSPKGH